MRVIKSVPLLEWVPDLGGRTRRDGANNAFFFVTPAKRGLLSSGEPKKEKEKE